MRKTSEKIIKAILKDYKNGKLNMREVAERNNVSVACVSKHVNHAIDNAGYIPKRLNTGTLGRKIQPATEEELLILKRVVIDHPFCSISEYAKILNSKYHVEICERTLLKHITDLGFKKGYVLP